MKGPRGDDGHSDDCYGKNAEHNVALVPVGTVVRDLEGKIIADLDEDDMMFIAARGGAGGHGNAYFKSPTQQTPMISEYGGEGEDVQYVLEIKSMAHIGLASILIVLKIMLKFFLVSKLKLKLLCYLDWFSQRRKKYFVKIYISSEAQSSSLSVHNTEASHRDGFV